MKNLNRRLFVALLAALSAIVADAQQPRYQVGVCDWMILKRQKLGQFDLARQLDADGV